jgi:outer membrane receptor protein involved in Fe transport
LDLFPHRGYFDSLEVTKTYTPDQSANSTGGINMKIKELPDQFFATLSTGVGGHSIATGNDDFLTSGRVTSQDRWAMGADDRALPKEATEFPENLTKPVFPIPGVPVTPPFISQEEKDVAVAEATAITDKLGRNMHAFGEAPELDHSFKFSAGDSRLFFNDRVRLGIIGGVNYSRKARMVEDAEFFRRATPISGTNTLSPESFVDPSAEGKYENKLKTVSNYTSVFSWLLGLGVEIDEKHSIRVNRLDLRISEDEVTRLRGDVYNEFAGDLGYSGDLVQEYSESLHYQERRLVSDQIYGDHLFELPTNVFFDDILLDWGYASDSASQDEPGFIQTRALLFADNETFTLTQNPSSPTAPAAQYAIWRSISEEKESKKLDFSFRRDIDGAFESLVKIGYLGADADRNVLDEFVSFLGTDLVTPTNGVEIPAGDIDETPFENFDNLEASGYEISANVDLFTESDGRYFMLDQTFFEKLRLIGGYRYEKNSAEVSVNGELKLRGAGSNNPLASLPTEGGYDEEGWYPGITLIFSPTDSLNLRVAYSNTIALPSAREVSPYASSSFQGSDVDVGNPELTPSNVDNFDMGFSYLRDNGDSLSFTVFRKKVEGRIEKLTGLGATTFSPVVNDDQFNLDNYPDLFIRSQNILGGATLLSWYNNPNDAILSGIEIDARKNLGFINEALSRFSIGGNFTYIDGQVDRFPIEIAGKNDVMRPVSESRGLTEQPESIYNFDLSYDDPDFGLKVALIYYRISDVLESVSLQDSYDVYRKSYDQLDFTVSKKIGDHFKLSLSAKNITDTFRESYYDVEGQEVTRDNYKVGTSYSLSVSYDF